MSSSDSTGTATLSPSTNGRLTAEALEEATIRFCGDSGDGMQLTGSQFTTTTGVAGNDLMTFPDFPAEIRAPQGTLAGVSGFQIHFSNREIFTPGDQVDVLVAMNPAALKSNIEDLKRGGILLANTDAFDRRNLDKVKYAENPLDDDTIQERFQIIRAPITQLTRTALEDLGLPQNQVDRCKNFFALGITYWLYSRNPETTLDWIARKFKGRDQLIEANRRALKAGFNFAETSELFHHRYEIGEAKLKPGLYRNVNGGSAMALGLVSAAKKAGLALFYGSYPITPASEILHELSRYRNYGVKAFQAEDEIAAVAAAIGAAYGGALGVTASSGPGINLKLEAINLAVMTELPLVIINAQRGGPSTGLPTKTEQGDLLQTLFGRNGESPVPVVAPYSPGDCFAAAIEAVRIALEYMTPVFILSDLYITMGSEPWRVPDVAELPEIKTRQIAAGSSAEGFQVYERDPNTLARRWPLPGTPGFEHRIGGLEKDQKTGNVSYDPENHEAMILTRAEKVARIANSIPDIEVDGEAGGLLVLGWGSTYGSIRSAVQQARQEGHRVAQAHLRHLNPFPKNLKDVLSRFETVLVPELNLGQLSLLLRANFLREIVGLNKMKGRPFLVSEIKEKIIELAK
ncbi:MAG: 2-oxoacid:acceptor oxidoreductase subunit alpha [Spirochaetales bacterium]|nr:2-oxoacid:acceptor oxidoreductase subunit alpha [Leptospiraceae bacterium]MCP5481848.1 2-oxoacid:acceptor oxidoreductase subunit alpha [Spirochaetales bacterium]MCP5486345.1 2-oxoacid:acceptor oxidoreductase subunit alpha [Spirochaetales bacterium]